MARAPSGGKTKVQREAEEAGRAVGAGRAVESKTVDFNDPNRPKTCLEVDFPILPVNGIAAMEAHAGVTTKPIYQMGKWWARRPSSVFRTLLISGATAAPDDPAEAGRIIWDAYYANHQKRRSFAGLKVADIFMGGGTTIVEGSRLGMEMFGNDLNPVAWFVVKTELAQVTKEEVEALLADIEAEVKPQIMPYYACPGPHGERGTWTRISTNEVMGDDFDPLALKPDERQNFRYDGPEIIYAFWAKHGPCQVMGCGHRTPIMTSPVIAAKEPSIKAWAYKCKSCDTTFDIEECEARMAPDAPLVLAPDETPFSTLSKSGSVKCPRCGTVEVLPALDKGRRKKVSLSLLVHPQWLAGSPSKDEFGRPLGGSVSDDSDTSVPWHRERASKMRMLEVRGTLPPQVTCPETGVSFGVTEGTTPKDAHFACGACGTAQRIVTATEASQRSAPIAPYAIQGFSQKLKSSGAAYGGRFFRPADDARSLSAAFVEWEQRKESDLAGYWPRSEIPFGHMTHQRQPLAQHGFLRWSDMFNSRQLLVHALLLRAIHKVGGEAKHRWEVREVVLSAFQQFLRNENMFSFYHFTLDTLAPALSNGNFHPKPTVVEVGVFAPMGYGPWSSSSPSLARALEWSANPWDLVRTVKPSSADDDPTQKRVGNTLKVLCGDPPMVAGRVALSCESATNLEGINSGAIDLVITDPPFGGLVHYSELSDFFYVWLRLILKDRYPTHFGSEYTPKTLEAVSNKARQPDDPDGYYQRLITASWREANRILKPGGILAFTFHHSEDAPWVSVLESLFDAGFYLEATYPIRSDETKGDGEFGSKQIEYDIIHVCRKRMEDPTAVSWAKMRREVLQDVRGLKQMLEHHQKAGLPEADLQVIRRGKALEYYSRHYGKVLVDDGRSMSVLEALVGINQLLDEESGGVKDPPPVTAEPFTRQFLRLFDGTTELARDQIQKFLRGTGIAPSDFEARGWCKEDKKVFQLVSPLDLARTWQGKHRRGMSSDYDQAAFLIGSCFENSGINTTETLSNDNFKPHPALESLLGWFALRGGTQEVKNAASRAQTILRAWRAKHTTKAQQMSLFFDDQAS